MQLFVPNALMDLDKNSPQCNHQNCQKLELLSEILSVSSIKRGLNPVPIIVDLIYIAIFSYVVEIVEFYLPSKKIEIVSVVWEVLTFKISKSKNLPN